MGAVVVALAVAVVVAVAVAVVVAFAVVVAVVVAVDFVVAVAVAFRAGLEQTRRRDIRVQMSHYQPINGWLYVTFWGYEDASSPAYIRLMDNTSPQQTIPPPPHKPFTDLTEDEISGLTTADLLAYEAQAEAERKRQNKIYRNLKNKLARERELAGKSPWDDRKRRNKFLYRLGIGAFYYLAELKGDKADLSFSRLFDRIREDDKEFTSDFYARWKEAGFPLNAAFKIPEDQQTAETPTQEKSDIDSTEP